MYEPETTASETSASDADHEDRHGEPGCDPDPDFNVEGPGGQNDSGEAQVCEPPP